MKFAKFFEKGIDIMNSFPGKIRNARANLDMNQSRLAELVGVSQRSITAYERGKAIPRGNVVRKLAQALHISVEYLMNDAVDDPHAGLANEEFINNARDLYGERGVKDADMLLEQNKALFAGGDLSQEAKDAFFEALMVAYVTCKEEAKKTYGKKKEPCCRYRKMIPAARLLLTIRSSEC